MPANNILRLLPFKARITFYNSLILPLFDYSDIVWGDKNNITLMSSLQVLQNKAAKLILDRPLYSSATEALSILEWPTLSKRRFFRRCTYIFKCVNDLISYHIELSSNNNRYNTRNSNDIRLPKVTRNWGKQRTAYHAVNDFNSLPTFLKSLKTLKLFKRELHNYLKSN